MKLKTEDKIAILELARKRLGRGGKNWIKGAWFGTNRYFDSYGDPRAYVVHWSRAECFCLEGAIEIAAYELGLKNTPQLNETATAAVSIKDYVRSHEERISTHGFNDSHLTTWKDVLRVINGRLRQLRKELQS